MKRLAMLLVLLSVSVFAVGCAPKTEPPKQPAESTLPAPEAQGGGEAPAETPAEKPAETPNP